MKKLLLATFLALGLSVVMVKAASAPTTPLLGINTTTSGYGGTQTYTLVDPYNVTASLISQNSTINGNQTILGNSTVSGTSTLTGGISGSVSVIAGTIAVSTSSTAGLSGTFAGVFQTLPTTGYPEATLAYQLSNHTLYVSTQTVSQTGSWLAL